MENNRHTLKWSLTVLVFAILIIIVGYFASIILKDKPDTGNVTAEKSIGKNVDGNDGRNGSTEGQVKFDPTQENGEAARVTAGVCSNVIQVEKGSINVLILGQDKTSNLYDTIGIVSIEKANKTMKIFMIPRDTYIEYSSQVMNVVKDKGISKSAGVFKINNAHNIGSMFNYNGKFETGSISFLADVIKEKFGVSVDDYARFNTKGFVKFVDLFGGIELNVPYYMNYDDPTQDLHIHLNKGRQHLDGDEAEGFVRFRQGYREDGTFFNIGDIARKKNQTTFIKEFIRQHGSIKNINKMPKILNLLEKNLKTSIGIGDVLTNYMGIAKDIVSNNYEIESVVLDGKQIWINKSAYIDIE